MNKQNEFELMQKASKVYGGSLWARMFTICKGVVANAPKEVTEAAIGNAAIKDPSADDIRKLSPGLYYVHSSRFNNTQLLVKYPGDEWSYAGVVRDKEGNVLLDENHEYEVAQVKARNELAITLPNKEVITIEQGFETIKAFALN